MKQKALEKYRPEEFLPGPSVGDDDASLAKAAGDIGTTIFHPVGTAKMGTANDPMAVVDERLRFYGLHGLRIADASVMPTITSGNTNTPTAMIAEKGAAMILAGCADSGFDGTAAANSAVGDARHADRAEAMGRSRLGQTAGAAACTAPALSPRSGPRWREALAADYAVYAYDRRGHGGSHKPPAERYPSRVSPGTSASWSKRWT